jgi:hypothetical protein
MPKRHSPYIERRFNKWERLGEVISSLIYSCIAESFTRMVDNTMGNRVLIATHDMVGDNTPRIAQFKRSFGRRFVLYVTFHRSKNWFTRFGEYGYRSSAPLARRVASRLYK